MNKIALILALLALCACQQKVVTVEPADYIIRGQRIWTANPDTPWATALAVRGNRIVAVGGDEAVAPYHGAGTETVEVGQGLVLPGFIDSHVHLMPSSFELSSVQLRDARTPGEFAQRIAAYSRGLEPGQWVQGGTWDHQNWGGELPHREWIDRETPDTPVMVVRLDGHMVLANSKALALAGVNATTADVPGGEIVRDSTGEPTGVLKDNAMDLVAKVIPPPTAAQEDQALAAGMDYLVANGVTTVHDMSYDWAGLATYRRAHSAKALKTRIYASVPIVDWARLAEAVGQQGRGDDWLRIGGVKGFMDGSLGSHTAAMFEPFSDTPDDSGFFLTEPADMRRMALAAGKAGLQLNIHAIGTKANAELLDIFQAVAAVSENPDPRFRIEHAQHLRPEEIARIAAMKVIPSMQPFHAIDDGRWAESVIGAQRARHTYAFRSLLEAGATVAFGSDWSVAPAEPLYGIYAAVTRQTLDGDHPKGWVPEQKISVEQALVAYTRSAAYASFEDDRKGKLAPGMLADIVILDQDITRIPPEQIKSVQVLRTIVDGKTVFQR